MLNGLMTQLRRIDIGKNIEEAHMRNRQLIARWVLEKGKADNVLALIKENGKTYLKINDYQKLRVLFGQLLAEIQRIKSTGDYEGARNLIETYAVKVDPVLQKEIIDRFAKLNIAPYKGFVNPVYTPVYRKDGTIKDVKVSYKEGYTEQMLRYSHDYSPLPTFNN
jgi:dipeptidyl-peptidase-3